MPNGCFVCFLVPMLLRGNAYSRMGYHGGPWEPESRFLETEKNLTTKVTKNTKTQSLLQNSVIPACF